jgi:hypothetical protein
MDGEKEVNPKGCGVNGELRFSGHAPREGLSVRAGRI